MVTAHFFGAPSVWGSEAAAPGEERLWVGSGQVFADHKVNKTLQEAGALGLFTAVFSHSGVCPKGWPTCWLRPWVMESEIQALTPTSCVILNKVYVLSELQFLYL